MLCISILEDAISIILAYRLNILKRFLSLVMFISYTLNHSLIMNLFLKEILIFFIDMPFYLFKSFLILRLKLKSFKRTVNFYFI